MPDASNVRIAANGNVYVAPVGTTAPTDPSATPGVGWQEIGYISEDGATTTLSKSVEDIMAWQAVEPIRKVVTERALTVQFAMREWNPGTIALAFDGASITEDDGIYTLTPPPPETIAEKAMVVKWQDGDIDYMLLIPRGMVQDDVEFALNRTSAADLGVTFAALATGGVAPWLLITNDPAYAA